MATVVAALVITVVPGCDDDAGSPSNDFADKVRPSLSSADAKKLSDDEIVDLVKYACRNMENGYSYAETQAQVEVRGKLTAADADQLLQAGTAEYCPKYEPDQGP